MPPPPPHSLPYPPLLCLLCLVFFFFSLLSVSFLNLLWDKKTRDYVRSRFTKSAQVFIGHLFKNSGRFFAKRLQIVKNGSLIFLASSGPLPEAAKRASVSFHGKCSCFHQPPFEKRKTKRERRLLRLEIKFTSKMRHRFRCACSVHVPKCQ